MIQIRDKQNCAGCTACMAACPQNAISMVEDEQGFLYPIVDEEKCINCDICNLSCPMLKTYSSLNEYSAYAVKHKDICVLNDSTSGGIFTAVSDYILDQGGVVYGAALDNEMVVRHIRGISPKERNRMRGSKYVQSDLGNTLEQVRNDLSAGKTVLFTGTPCQVAGLKSYLKKEYDNLICMDLVCYGVANPRVFRDHIYLLSKKLHTIIKGYSFRPKKWGWHANRALVFGDHKVFHSTPYTDLWSQLYYSRIVTRPSCNKCPYSNLYRNGDISIGDCQGIDKVLPNFGSYNGVSLAIVNTQKGRAVFDAISNAVVYEQLNIEDIMQPPLKGPGKANKSSDQFYAIYNQYGYEAAIRDRFGRLFSLKYYVKKFLKRG